MKEATQVTAAIEIVEATRSAIADAMEARKEVRWDAQILVHEFARLLALMLRNEDVMPSQLEDVLTFLREVYAGVYPTAMMSVEQAVRQFCAGQEPDADPPSETGSPHVLH